MLKQRLAAPVQRAQRRQLRGRLPKLLTYVSERLARHMIERIERRARHAHEARLDRRPYAPARSKAPSKHVLLPRPQ